MVPRAIKINPDNLKNTKLMQTLHGQMGNNQNGGMLMQYMKSQEYLQEKKKSVQCNGNEGINYTSRQQAESFNENSRNG